MDDPLHRFATRVVEIQERNAQPKLDPEAMAAVAKELGMSDEDLNKMREEARSAKTRAKTLRMAGNLDEAIDTLETAHAFHPMDLEVTHALADALFSRSQKTGVDIAQQEAEWMRAKGLTMSVVEAAPAQAEAAVLLKAIANNQPSAKDTSIPWGVIIGIGVAIAMVVGLLMFLL
jgi:hypothetical protein